MRQQELWADANRLVAPFDAPGSSPLAYTRMYKFWRDQRCLRASGIKFDIMDGIGPIDLGTIARNSRSVPAYAEESDVGLYNLKLKVLNIQLAKISQMFFGKL